MRAHHGGMLLGSLFGMTQRDVHIASKGPEVRCDSLADAITEDQVVQAGSEGLRQGDQGLKRRPALPAEFVHAEAAAILVITGYLFRRWILRVLCGAGVLRDDQRVHRQRRLGGQRHTSARQYLRGRDAGRSAPEKCATAVRLPVEGRYMPVGGSEVPEPEQVVKVALA